MDKELMAKINEALKANGRRELSMDDLDKVVGGESCREYYPLADGTIVTEGELTTHFRTLANMMGYNATAMIFCDMTGLAHSTISECQSGSGKDIDSMDLLLNRFFNAHDNGR